MGGAQIVLSILTGILTLILYFILFGKRHKRDRDKLTYDLSQAQQKVYQLTQKLKELDELENPSIHNNKTPKKEIRIWMDGAFDVMHYGHMNAFRQGKALGTFLIVGVNDDQSITECKGAPPLMNENERMTSVEGCKFVDVVEPHCPYIMNEEYLNQMIEKYQIDYIVHGDDPCTVDGKDVYESAKKMGKYRTIPRTEGVSTSDILGRMLVLNKSHFMYQQTTNPLGQLNSMARNQSMGELTIATGSTGAPGQMHMGSGTNGIVLPYESRPSTFYTTNRMLRLFSEGTIQPPKDAVIVYIDGSFDMFHAGHVHALKEALSFGTYLIVGVHNDQIVNKRKGFNYPIMNLHERVLSVLGCKYVSDVLIDAPVVVTKEMIASLKINVVVHGKKMKENLNENCRSKADEEDDDCDYIYLNQEEKDLYKTRYDVPKQLGIYKNLQSKRTLSVKKIVERISANRERLEAKYKKKMESEKEYYELRYSQEKA